MTDSERIRATDEATRRYVIVRRFVYLALAAVVIVSLVVKFDLPGKPSYLTQKVYDAVNALEPGAPVLLSFDFDPSCKGELEPMGLAVLRHCFKKDLHPIVMTFWQSGVSLHKKMVQEVAEEYGKKSGEDYVFLGFKPGETMLILNMGESLTGAFDKDADGNSTGGMPALAGVKTLRDIKYSVTLAAGQTTEGWIAYGHDRFGYPLAAGCTAVIAPDMYPFLQTGQLDGLLGGLRGAADYELLVGHRGGGLDGMPPQSVAHLLIIALIVIANIEVFVSYCRRRYPRDLASRVNQVVGKGA